MYLSREADCEGPPPGVCVGRPPVPFRYECGGCRPARHHGGNRRVPHRQGDPRAAEEQGELPHRRRRGTRTRCRPRFGIAALAFGTVLSSLLALILATPVAIGVALFIATTRRAASRTSSATSSTCSPPCPASSTACGALRSSCRTCSPRRALASATHFGWIPLFGGDCVSGRSMLTGRDRARDHDPADHRRDHPRGLPPGAAAPTSRPLSRSARRAGR